MTWTLQPGAFWLTTNPVLAILVGLDVGLNVGLNTSLDVDLAPWKTPSPSRQHNGLLTMTENLTLLAALTAGLAGSAHCVGMCGPLAAMSGLKGGKTSVGSALFHNAGRLLSYALLGGAVGLLGQSLGDILPVAQAGPILRGLLGLVLVLLGLQLLAPTFRYNPLDALGRRLGTPLWQRLQPLALRLAKKPQATAALARGMLWGWLPCGLVYSLLALAAVSGSALQGAGVMVAFGLGTAPAMLGLGLMGGQLKRINTATLRPVMGAAMIAGGLAVAVVPGMHAGHSGHGQHGGHAHHGVPAPAADGGQPSSDAEDHHH